MMKYKIPLPIPTEGINCIESSLIAPTEAAEGTKNISFKNGMPQTRKGYIKACSHNFTTEVKSLVNYVKDGTRIVLAAAGVTALLMLFDRPRRSYKIDSAELIKRLGGAGFHE
jgi:hypothetical protein